MFCYKCLLEALEEELQREEAKMSSGNPQNGLLNHMPS
jgi:hypothetical protein